MATDVILPALGMAQDTGKIIEWLKAEGDSVTAGEPLVVIETDKAAVDLEAPATGILSRVAAKVGEEVPVAQVIAVILAPEEATPSPKEGGEPDAERVAHAPAHATTSTPGHAQRQPAQPVPIAHASSPFETQRANRRRQASPKARRIAAERGVDLAAVRGTG